jgi:phosphomannomutase
MKTAYFVSLASFSLHKELNQDSPIKFVNTSMHGVGHPFVVEAFKAFNFAPFVPVKEQQVPDPEFPTVSFPNPEEKGAMVCEGRRAWVRITPTIYTIAGSRNSNCR